MNWDQCQKLNELLTTEGNGEAFQATVLENIDNLTPLAVEIILSGIVLTPEWIRANLLFCQQILPALDRWVSQVGLRSQFRMGFLEGFVNDHQVGHVPSQSPSI